MPKTYAKIGFVDVSGSNKPYSLDIGDNRNVTSGFYLPKSLEGMTVAQLQTIASAVDGHAISLGKTEIIPYSNPCPDEANFSPRKLIFILNNGSSVGIPVSSKSGIVSTATLIKTTLDEINSNTRVVCIKLQGEEIPNLNSELGLTFNPDSRATSSGSSSYYSGKITYSSDVSGNVPGYPVKVASSLQQVPPIFGDIWSSCVGDFQTLPSCGTGRSNPVEHRRYIVKYQIQPDPARPNEPNFETRELPVNSIDPTQIKNCGTLLATQSSIFCISYKGEDNKNVIRAIV